MHRTFAATQPQDLFIELPSGELRLTAAEVVEVDVEVTGRRADEVVIEHSSDQVTVVAPRGMGFLGSSGDLTVTVTAPVGSSLVAKLGSARFTGRGILGAVQITSGSGAVALEEVLEHLLVKTGSGSITVRRLHAHGQLKTGSGEITVGRADDTARLATGSGDVEVGHALGPVALKSGSGDLVVGTAGSDASLSSASGDLRIGRISRGQAQLKNASGDIRIGIPQGTPVWTDVSSNTGRVRSNLAPTGAPADGQAYVEVRAQTVTGDIVLEPVPPVEQTEPSQSQPQSQAQAVPQPQLQSPAHRPEQL